jgi:hypothetical protein
MRPVFHPTEAAIVRIALGLPEAPEDHQLDLWKPVRDVVSLHPDESDDLNLRKAANNALARMLLSGYEGTLPAYLWSAGGVVHSTRPDVGRKRFKTELLFGINWASSAPGVSWPEMYHLSWLPVFDRWVVVASRDTDEVDGYCDRVLDHFADCDEPVSEAAKVIERYWAGLLEYEQERFEEVTDTGSISDVDEIADRVWGNCNEVDEEEAEEVNDE